MEESGSAASAGSGGRALPLFLAAALFAACAALYQPSTRFDFSLDDTLLMQKNRDVSGSRVSYLRFFRSSLYAGAPAGDENANLYRPLLKASIALDRSLAGGRFDPASFHRSNAILYAACVLVVFFFVHRMLRATPLRGWRFAFAVALLFGALPSHLESVCNVKHREEILACLFGLAAWTLALRPATARSPAAVAGAALLFLAALLSKESAILLYPCMLLWALQRREIAAGVARRLPAHVYAIPLAIVAYFLLRWQALGALLNPAGTRTFFGDDVGTLARVLISSATFVEYYLWDQLLALRLDPAFSSPFVITSAGRPNALDVGAFGLLAAVGALAFRRFWTRRSVPAFWVLFVMITSFLTFHVVPIGSAGAFRFAFTPSVGLCVLLVWSAHGLAGALAARSARAPAWREAFFWAAVIALAASYAAATHGKMDVWRDDGRIFAHSAAVEPKNPLSRYAAGQHYGRSGDEAAKNAFFDEALDLFLAARSQPRLFDERSLDAFSVVATEVAYREVARDPERAVALAEVATAQFERLAALRGGRLDSNATAPYYVKALALQRLGRREESIAACREGLAIAGHPGLEQLLDSLRSRPR